MGAIPLPNMLSGVVVERVVRLDSALLYLANGALTALLDYQRYAQTGALTEDQVLAAMADMIDTYFNGAPPPPGDLMLGTIIPYATATPPAGVIECDGATYLTADFPALAAVLDTAFIISPTQFRVPDLRGRTIIGAGTGSGLTARAVGALVGDETHVLTVAQLPAHNHSVNSTPNSTGGTANAFARAASHAGGTSLTANQGSGAAHNNMQPSLALRYGIVAIV